MNKTLAFVFAAVLTTTITVPAHATTNSWSAIPQLGATSFSLRGSEISGSRGGTQAGATFTFPTKYERLALESGLLYTQAGAKDDAIFVSVEYQLDYLTAPLGVRYRLSGSTAADSHWYTRTGVTLAYLMSATARAEVLGTSDEVDVKDQMRSFDTLPYVGIGYAWSMTQTQVIGLDLNYTRGLMNVLKDRSSNSEGWILAGSYAFMF